ncbi:MAG: fluoride efflux transporter FluC [Halobacteriales archaeon]
MTEARTVALVAAGGALGATARYLVVETAPSLVSTFAVNVVGCFAIGYILYAARFDAVSEEGRVLTATGFVSSFTTYSTFAVDVFTSRPAVAVVYVAASYFFGFAAVAAGSAVAGQGGPRNA